MWGRHDDGTWTADVGYANAPSENRIGTVRADMLRGLAENPLLLRQWLLVDESIDTA